MRHVEIYQIFSSRIYIGPKWYQVKFYTYRIILDKTPVSRLIYRYINRYLKQWVQSSSPSLGNNEQGFRCKVPITTVWKRDIQLVIAVINCKCGALPRAISTRPSGLCMEESCFFHFSDFWLAQLGHPRHKVQIAPHPTNLERINKFLFGCDSSFLNTL